MIVLHTHYHLCTCRMLYVSVSPDSTHLLPFCFPLPFPYPAPPNPPHTLFPLFLLFHNISHPSPRNLPLDPFLTHQLMNTHGLPAHHLQHHPLSPSIRIPILHPSFPFPTSRSRPSDPFPFLSTVRSPRSDISLLDALILSVMPPECLLHFVCKNHRLFHQQSRPTSPDNTRFTPG